MDNIENFLINEETEINEIVSSADDTTFLNVATKLYTITSVLCFLIFIVFIYKYLKNCFPKRR